MGGCSIIRTKLKHLLAPERRPDGRGQPLHGTRAVRACRKAGACPISTSAGLAELSMLIHARSRRVSVSVAPDSPQLAPEVRRRVRGGGSGPVPGLALLF